MMSTPPDEWTWLPDGPRTLPPVGSIGLVRIKGGGGAVIRALQWMNGDGFEDFEHAFVYVGNGEVVEAEPSGAWVNQLSDYMGMEILWIPCPRQYGPAVAVAARGFAQNRVPYSWLDYGACGLHHLHIPAPGLQNYIKTSKHMMCSQLADRAACLGGWHLFQDNRWDGYVTPGALYQRRTVLIGQYQMSLAA